VRGLGGKACDPTRTECRDKNHCVVCELFGCTGWARKFRFQVLDADGKPQKCQIKADQKFQLSFTPLRPVTDEEWALLDITLRLIADYGAIGGRTVLKPSDDKSRADQEHHKDYGLIQILREKSPVKAVDRKTLEHYVQPDHWRKVDHGNFAWASLEYFWCVKEEYLTRTDATTSTFNQFVGRHQSKFCRDCGKIHDPPQKCPKTQKHPMRFSDRDPPDELGKWLAGRRGESKKVFSFKEPKDARRTFGFVKPGTVRFDTIKVLLKTAWSELTDTQLNKKFLTKNDILQELFRPAGSES